MKYKIRIVLSREIEVDVDKTDKELKRDAMEIKPEIADDLGIDIDDIESLTIKKIKDK